MFVFLVGLCLFFLTNKKQSVILFLSYILERVMYGKRIDWLKRQKKDKTIVLFDMDGTLTEPRKEFSKKLLPVLRELSEKALIGIVTGSDYDYLKEQMKSVLSSHIRYRLHLLPCNGTKHYKPPKVSDQGFELSHNMNMRDSLGNSDFQQLMRLLLRTQGNIDLSKIPLTGHHIQYRGSMINWCPIGRNASTVDRQAFIDFDKSQSPSFRERIYGRLKDSLSLSNLADRLEVKMGGDTSFDIFPKGWDKTYCLNHFQGYTAWFVGDRCEVGGNDKEIYDFLSKQNKAFKTKNPFQTELLIKEEIIPLM
jgi:phosphomannomutase